MHLTEDNRCSIYEQHPILCNTEKMFELLSRALGVVHFPVVQSWTFINNMIKKG